MRENGIERIVVGLDGPVEWGTVGPGWSHLARSRSLRRVMNRSAVRHESNVDASAAPARSRRILLAMDPNGKAIAALSPTAELGRMSNADVVVLCVADSPEASPDAVVVQGVTSLLGAGVPARGEFRPGRKNVPWTIAEVARQVGAELIVLGARGRSGTLGSLLWSMSQLVRPRFSCRVMVVSCGDDSIVRPLHAGRVLLAVDRSEGAAVAERAAGELATDSDATVRVLHVRDVLHSEQCGLVVESVEQAEQLVREVADRLRGSGVSAECRVVARPEGIGAKIAIAAEDFEASTIVLGPRGLTDWNVWPPDSVVYDVVRRTRRPVLLAERHGRQVVPERELALSFGLTAGAHPHDWRG
jgi:nucleotide-binding universal stress UspA family protein